MSQSVFKAGAGSSPILMDNGCLPVDNVIGVHDDLHARVLLFEKNIRFALVSVEITSIFEETRDRFRTAAAEALGIPEENVWITLTHSFGGPHIWPAPKEGPWSKDKNAPMRNTDPEMIRKSALMEDEYCDAIVRACATARDTLSEAVIGWDKGTSMINISRNMPTDEGWWLSPNPEAPCDHTLNVLRIDHTDGTPLALLYNYGVRLIAAEGVRDQDGNSLVTGDIGGVTSTALEEEFGSGFVAMFLCGAAGDQEPVIKNTLEYPDHNGTFKKNDYTSGGYTILNALSGQLVSDVLQVWRGITPDETPDIYASTKDCAFKTKIMNRQLGTIKPVKSMTFEPNDDKILPVSVMTMGGFNLVGVQPETNGATSVQLAEAFPGEVTALAIMVNGSDKCMPEQEAYDNFMFQCQNSPFMPGSAEQMRDEAINLLKDLKGGN